MKRVLATITAVMLLGLLPSASAAAKTSVAFSCADTLVSVQPGTLWVEDGALHLRGQVMVYAGSGDPQCVGTMTSVINFNLDLSDWSGALWGTFDRTADATNGGWAGTFVGHWTTDNPLAPTAIDRWAGKIIGHGYGGLEGWQLRTSANSPTQVTLVSTSIAWEAGS